MEKPKSDIERVTELLVGSPKSKRTRKPVDPEIAAMQTIVWHVNALGKSIFEVEGIAPGRTDRLLAFAESRLREAGIVK